MSEWADIAIVGVSALYPGSIEKHGFWRDILQGRDLVTEVPPDHWLVEDYFDPSPGAKDKVYCKTGAFLQPVDFSPMEYGVTPSNLSSIDTSQLLALVVAKQVLEDAAQGRFREMDRDKISVILGIASSTELVGEMSGPLQWPILERALRGNGIPDERIEEIHQRVLNSYAPWTENTFPGLLGNVIAGRIANRFDLGGTNCVTDAACAGSLAALSMAMMELQTNHSDLVITGGVDTLGDIFTFMCFSKTTALSPTGDCRPFSDQADGTVLGEGIGMFALKRLADAERDGDQVYAVIKGMGSSSDGFGKSVYAPSAAGQAKALRRAYEQAGYSPATVELMEAHGTGTKAGDAAEFEGLTTVFAHEQEVTDPWCALGSVKSQIGHTKGAAGAAGLFKVVMALHHKVLPPTIKVERPNPKLNIHESPFYLNTEARPWIRDRAHPRRASVSSFGFGGSNFHVTVEEYTGPAKRPLRMRTLPTELFLWSAETPDELANQLNQIDPMDGFVLTAKETQLHFQAKQPVRLAIVATGSDDLRDKLRRAEKQILHNPKTAILGREDIYYGLGLKAGKMAFLFSGQGSQYVNMGAELAMGFEAARQVWDQLGTLTFEGRALHQVVFPHPCFTQADRAAQSEQLTRTEWAQPAIGVTSLAALAIFRALEISPDVVGGHSFGELTALCAAGAFSPETLITAARKRGELIARATLETPGSMTAVLGACEDLEGLIEQHGLRLVIANHNSPQQRVVSGQTGDIEQLEQQLREMSVRFQRLPVATGFHSPLVEAAVPEFETLMNEVPLAAPNIPVYANLTGTPYPVTTADIPSMLAKQIANPVLFEQQISAMYQAGVRTFIEVGPGSVLTRLVSQCLPGEPVTALSLDQPGRHGVTSVWHALGHLAVLGVPIQFAAIWDGVDTTTPTAASNAVDPKSKKGAIVQLSGTNYGRPPLAERPTSASPQGSKMTPETPMPTLAAAAHTPESRTHSSAASVSFQTKAKTGDLNMQRPIPHNPVQDPHALLSAFQDLQRQTMEAHIAYQQSMAASHTAFLRVAETTFLSLSAMVTGEVPAAAAALLQTPRDMAMVHDEPTVFGKAALPTADSSPSIVMPQAPTRPAPLSDHDRFPAPAFSSPVAALPTMGPQTPMSTASVMTSPGRSDMEAVAISTAQSTTATAVAVADEDPKQVLLDVVADKTGYPADMLDLGMTLEAELGIDSIKRVEILSALQERLGLSSVNPQELATLSTLGEIYDALQVDKKKQF